MRQNNPCGSSSWLTEYFNLYFSIYGCNGGGGGIGFATLAPNPSDGEFDIVVSGEEEIAALFEASQDPFRVSVTDLYSEEVYRGVLNKNGLKINLKHAKRGVYIVRIYSKDYEQQLRLILE